MGCQWQTEKRWLKREFQTWVSSFCHELLNFTGFCPVFFVFHVFFWTFYQYVYMIPVFALFSNSDCQQPLAHQTEFPHLLNKDREVSFLLFIQLYFSALQSIVVAHHCSRFCPLILFFVHNLAFAITST